MLLKLIVLLSLYLIVTGASPTGNPTQMSKKRVALSNYTQKLNFWIGQLKSYNLNSAEKRKIGMHGSSGECWCDTCNQQSTFGIIHQNKCFYMPLGLSFGCDDIMPHMNNPKPFSYIGRDDPLLSNFINEVKQNKLSVQIGLFGNTTTDNCTCQMLNITTLSISDSCQNVTTIFETNVYKVRDEPEDMTIQSGLTVETYFYFLGIGIIFLIIGIIIGIVFLSNFYKMSDDQSHFTNQHP